MSRDESKMDRRSVLKSIGTGAALLSATGISSAAERSTIDLDTKAELVGRYEADSLTDETVESHLQSELDFLAAEGVVDEATLDRLPTNTHIEEREGLRADEDREGFAITAVEGEGDPTAHVAVKFTDGEDDIALYSQPERDESYAIVQDSSGEKAIYKASSGRVFDSGCDGNCKCGEECNMYHQKYEIHTLCCYDDHGYGCTIEDKECICQCF